MEEQEAVFYHMKTGAQITYQSLRGIVRLWKSHSQKKETKSFEKGGYKDPQQMLTHGSVSPQDISKFSENFANLDALAAEFYQYGVNFSFRELPNGGMELLTHFPDQNRVADILQNMENKLTKDPLKFTRQGPTVEEELNKVKKAYSKSRANSHIKKAMKRRAKGASL